MGELEPGSGPQISGIASSGIRTDLPADVEVLPRRSLAREYRRRRDRRQAPYHMMVAALLLLGMVNFTAYYGLHAAAPGSPNGTPTGGLADNLTLGAPSLHTTTCGDGRNITTEWVPWVGAQFVPSTNQVFVEVQELLDGDIDGGPAPTPSVTADSFCSGSPPSTSPSWYVVLRPPVGNNVAFFSYSSNWVILNHASADIPITNGSTLVLVANPPLAGRSFALCIMGETGARFLNACSQL
jgi:hypothetical protein